MEVMLGGAMPLADAIFHHRQKASCSQRELHRPYNAALDRRFSSLFLHPLPDKPLNLSLLSFFPSDTPESLSSSNRTASSCRVTHQ